MLERRRVAAVALAGLTFLVGGCSTGGGGSDSMAAGDAGAVGEPGAVGEAAADRAEARPKFGAGRESVQTRAVISVGRVSLEAEELTAVRDEIDRLLGRFGGYVTDERTVNDDEGQPRHSTLQLRVPSDHFDAVMTAFEEFSTVTNADREATDVTTEVIDVDARVRTQQVSLQRLRTFLGRAGDVDSMIRLESEIAEREATLSSLVAQQKYLHDQTSLSWLRATRRVSAPSARGRSR